MKLASFAYDAPTSVEEAAGLLVESGSDAAVLAGGQSLLPALALRLGQPARLVDINRISELAELGRSNGTVTVGATVRQHQALVSDELRSWCPLVCEALPHVGVRATRSRGTVVGSIAHADPAAELPAVAVALDGEVELRHGDVTRVVPAEEFFIAPFMTVRAPGELVTALRLRASSPRARWSFRELERGPFALVAVAAGLEQDEQGRVTDARVALAGVGSGPVRARAAERLLIGVEPSDEALDEAAAAATRDLEPASDALASASYRRHVARELAREALRAAARKGDET